MGTFEVSLRAIGDVKALPAKVVLDDGQISITAGRVDIGTWSLKDVHFEPIPTGYRMAAEGEQVLIELRDIDGFYAALQEGRRRRFRRGAKPKAEKKTVSQTAPAPTRTRSTTVALSPRDEEVKPTGWTEKGLAFVDGTLARANRRFGPYLPDWVFTRVMFGVAFGALILAIVFPGLVSSFLLIGGAMLVVLGAIVYSDSMLASRWLPGRTTPTHVLLFGVAVLMFGVLLGVIAR